MSVKKLIIFLILCFNILYGFYEFSLVGYQSHKSGLFLNPAVAGLLNKFNLEVGYGMLYRSILENNLYTTQLATCFNFKNIFFGLGHNSVILQDIYSEEFFLFNFGIGLFNKKIIFGGNIRYYLFRYIYDEYYQNDPLREEEITTYNFDFGIVYRFLSNFVLSCSGVNLYDLKFVESLNATLPKKYIFSLGYRYNGGFLNFETHLNNFYINNQTELHLDYKLGISQTIFNSKTISCDILFICKMSKDFMGFSFSLYNKLINKLGLRYIWYYPVSDIARFSGNHYFILDFEFGEKLKAEKIKISEVREKPKKEDKKGKEKIVPSKKLDEKIIREISFEEKTEDIKVSTVSLETKEIKTQQLVEKPTSFLIPSVKEEKAKQQEGASLDISTSAVIRQKIEPQKIAERPLTPHTYKFPLAHKVKEGETLISISKKYYNTEKYWKKIYEANRDKIIKGIPIVGEILIIPEP
ncbi:MAG: LysM peptidoglycan-binding domain-containing protein [Endomicrobia bacterium]|nr:LysM peptidoglycan-binding domain-containing protein [Endomicrobiia bacterium]